MSTKNGTTYVGLDVHKEFINVAVLPSRGKDFLGEWKISPGMKSVRKMIRKVEKLSGSGEIRCAYEAGPSGYALQRQLESMGVNCVVAAPSLIPVKPGERVKTDKRDAQKLATMHRSELLTEVFVPTEEEEAVRDLSRARESAKKDLMRSRHRLVKFLSRRDIVYREGRHWTGKHWAWVRRIRLEDPIAQKVLETCILSIEQTDARAKDLASELEKVAETEPYRKQVGWLRCLRGIDTITAISILAELFDIRRFRCARDLMSYLGMTPSEYTTGDTPRRGGITKTGNSHVRRLLVEAALHYRHRPTISKPMKKRREGQPERVIAIADRAQIRLYKKLYKMREVERKHHNIATTAVARELVGFIWAILWHEDMPILEG